MNYFKGIIFCQICGRKYNFKNNNGCSHIYVCSTVKNYGRDKCSALPVREDWLIDIVRQHIEIQNKIYDDSKIKLFVREVKIHPDYVKILYKDGTYSEVTSDSITY